MENAFFKIFEVALAFIDTIFMFWFYDKMLQNKKRKMPLDIAQAVIIGIILACDHFKFWNSAKLLSIIIIGLVALYYSYDISIKRIFTVYIMWLGIMISSEIIIVELLVTVFGDQAATDFATEGTEFRVISVILIKTFYFFIIMLVAKRYGNPYSRYNYKQLAILSLQALSSFATIFITFELSIYGKSSNVLPPYIYSILAMINLFALCSSFIMVEHYYVTSEKEKQLIEAQAYVDKQFQYYQSKSENQELLKNIYHDLKHHLLALDTLQNKNSNEMKEYMEYINEQLNRSKYFHNTGNSVVDVILQDKLEKAEQEGIEVEVRVEDNTLQHYPTVYLCSIFANALDNAIEASRQVPNKGMLRLKLVAQKAGISLLIENSFVGKRLKQQGRFITTKEDKANHGIGLQSIQNAVVQCNGSLVVETKESMFSLFILLP